MYDRRKGFAAFRRAQSELRKAGTRRWGLRRFSLNVGETKMVRILPPVEDSFPLFKHHWLRRTPHLCTADQLGGCCYCYANDHYGKNSPPRAFLAVEVIDFTYYHVVPQDERDRYVICEAGEALPAGRGINTCSYCRSADARIRERMFGGRLVWEVSSRLFSQIEVQNERLAGTCVHGLEYGAPCGARTVTVGYACATCGAEIISEEDLRRMPPEQVERMQLEADRCPACGEQLLLLPTLVCATGGHEALPGSIFDKTLEVTCSGQERRGRTYRAYSFDKSAPFRPLEQELEEVLGEDEDRIQELLKPLDLTKVYQPEGIDSSNFEMEEAFATAVFQAQAKVLGIENPFRVAPESRSLFRTQIGKNR